MVNLKSPMGTDVTVIDSHSELSHAMGTAYDEVDPSVEVDDRVKPDVETRWAFGRPRPNSGIEPSPVIAPDTRWAVGKPRPGTA